MRNACSWGSLFVSAGCHLIVQMSHALASELGPISFDQLYGNVSNKVFLYESPFGFRKYRWT